MFKSGGKQYLGVCYTVYKELNSIPPIYFDGWLTVSGTNIESTRHSIREWCNVRVVERSQVFVESGRTCGVRVSRKKSVVC
jgi:hypothetical protein